MNTMSPSSISSVPSPGPVPVRQRRWTRLAAPATFYLWSGRLVPWAYALALLLIGVGLWLGLVVAPTDHQQGDVYRILFVHVPAAWVGMVAYLAMAFWGAVGLAWRTRLAFLLMRALAPTGAIFTLLCLWTGALWGRPTWGAWWVWDARLTSMLLLLFLYVGFLALQSAIADAGQADRAGAVLALAGAINVPVIYFSVTWWNTLHQGASIRVDGTSMTATMLWALLTCALGFWAGAIATVLSRARTLVLERERHATWVARLPELVR
jgi:heme exporter protein C